jgi:hypothetical protein
VGAPNCRGPLVLELTLTTVRYATGWESNLRPLEVQKVVGSKGRRFDSHRGQAYFSSLPGAGGYTLRVTSQASYSPEYITSTQKNHDYY